MIQRPPQHVLVTGSAGFIGHAAAQALLDAGMQVTGIDSLNEYYDVRLKNARTAMLERNPHFRFIRGDLTNKAETHWLFKSTLFDAVAHLAAQPGVRWSIEAPYEYHDANLKAFLNVLEGCRTQRVKHLLYASSSSVYGRSRLTVTETMPTDSPESFYAATKKCNEVMAHAYSNLYGIPATGMRFFTVYGPWGRPDMAAWIFTRSIMSGEPLHLYNEGNMVRDFTYIDDAAECITRLVGCPPEKHRLLNIGNERPVLLADFVDELERLIGTPAKRVMMPMQPGDVPATHADCSALEKVIGYKPHTHIDAGLARWVEWYKDYHREAAA